MSPRPKVTLCQGCGDELSLPPPGSRGANRTWCSEACKRRTLRNRQVLFLHGLIVRATAPKAGAGELAELFEYLDPQVEAAMSWEQQRQAKLDGRRKRTRKVEK